MYRFIFRFIVLALLSSGFAISYALADERESVQAELDRKCEAARDMKLAPVRSQIFDECMSAERSTDTEEDCERKASGYNGNRMNGGPLYYDLPACVAAFEHKRKVQGLD